MRLGIVAIGYNRADNMERLLSGLQACEYGQDDVMLIISLDKWKTNEVEQCANKFEWMHGEKIVKTFQERQGLRQHILKCGGYMEEHELDAVAVFEDDILPSVDFYQFMKQAVSFYGQDERVAGIGLYSFLWHPIANKPFYPMQGKGSVYLNQFAVSWGQIWLRKQWNDFVEWYQKIDDVYMEQIRIPQNVKDWKNSWLKYHIAYCCDKQKYFVYPYKALATCFTEQGAHTKEQLPQYQVPIVEESGSIYEFYPIDDIIIRYDSFFESEYLAQYLSDKGYDVNIDLYGLKGIDREKRYWLITEEEDFQVVESYALSLKPHEKNVMCKISGGDIFLYDTSIACQHEKRDFSIVKFLYYFNGSLDKRFLSYHIKRTLKGKWERLFYAKRKS